MINKTNRALFAIFLVLFFFVILESIYYFSLSNARSSKPKVVSILKTTSANLANYLSSNYTITNTSDNVAKITFKGNIIRIEKNKKQIQSHTKMSYDYVIVGKEGSKINYFYYDSGNLDIKDKFSIKDGGKIINIDDLKAGDFVYIRLTMDLKRDFEDSLIKYEVVKNPNLIDTLRWYL